jgi:hypothetical protein
MLNELRNFFLKRGITVQEDKEVHRRTLWKTFLAAFIFSLLYGMYEYLIVYHYPRVLDLYGGNPIINWGMMYSSLILTAAIAPRFRWYKTLAMVLSYCAAYILAGIFFQVFLIHILIIAVVISLIYVVSFENTIMGLFLMTVFEDFIYFMSQWVDSGIYPYPACTIGVPESCWWNNSLTTFRVLGNLGNPLPFWPYIPIYYIPGLILIIAYFLIAYKSAVYGRTYSWVIGTFFLAIIAGALVGSDYIATMILIFLPLGLLAYALILVFREYYHLKRKFVKEG